MLESVQWFLRVVVVTHLREVLRGETVTVLSFKFAGLARALRLLINVSWLLGYCAQFRSLEGSAFAFDLIADV